MGKMTVAITQMASENDWRKNCDKADALVRDAAKQGAQLVLLQELFDGDYFCIEQHTKFFKNAHEIERHPTVARFSALAKELGVVLPVSVFERAGQAHYNTTVMVDADGKLTVGGDVKSTVTAEIVAQVKGETVIAYKQKRRKGFHKKKGHRTAYTKIKITGIN